MSSSYSALRWQAPLPFDSAIVWFIFHTELSGSNNSVRTQRNTVKYLPMEVLTVMVEEKNSEFYCHCNIHNVEKRHHDAAGSAELKKGLRLLSTTSFVFLQQIYLSYKSNSGVRTSTCIIFSLYHSAKKLINNRLHRIGILESLSEKDLPDLRKQARNYTSSGFPSCKNLRYCMNFPT